MVTAPRKDKVNGFFYISMFHHRRHIASGIFPRLCATGFNFCQPFLIQRVIMYLSTSNQDTFTKQLGHGLIGAYCIVYVGLSVSQMPQLSFLLLPSTKALQRYRKHGTNIRLTDLLQSFEEASLVLSTKEL